MNLCTICGGNVGGFSSRGSHLLCEQQKRLGLPTPCLGMACPTCEGRGHIAKTQAGPMLDLAIGPMAIRRSIEACFPTCPDCKGAGVDPMTVGRK